MSTILNDKLRGTVRTMSYCNIDNYKVDLNFNGLHSVITEYELKSLESYFDN